MKSLLLIATALFFSASFTGVAKADLGPKPRIEIQLPSELVGNVRDGELLLCQQPDCSDAKELQNIGPQYFDCLQDSCGGLAYGFAPYLQLRITLNDGQQITSAVFTKKEFEARFQASLNGDELIVTEQ